MKPATPTRIEIADDITAEIDADTILTIAREIQHQRRAAIRETPAAPTKKPKPLTKKR